MSKMSVQPSPAPAGPSVQDITYSAPNIASSRYRFQDLFLVPSTATIGGGDVQMSYSLDSPLHTQSSPPNTAASNGGSLRYVTQDGRCALCTFTSSSLTHCKHCPVCPRCESACMPHINGKMEVWLLCEFCHWRTETFADLAALNAASSSSAASPVAPAGAAASGATKKSGSTVTQRCGSEDLHKHDISFSRMANEALNNNPTNNNKAHDSPPSSQASLSHVEQFDIALRAQTQSFLNNKSLDSVQPEPSVVKLRTFSSAAEELATVTLANLKPQPQIPSRSDRKGEDDEGRDATTAAQASKELAAASLLSVGKVVVASSSTPTDTDPSLARHAVLIKRHAVVWTPPTTSSSSSSASSLLSTQSAANLRSTSSALSSAAAGNAKHTPNRPDVRILKDMQQALLNGVALNVVEVDNNSGTASTATAAAVSPVVDEAGGGGGGSPVATATDEVGSPATAAAASASSGGGGSTFPSSSIDHFCSLKTNVTLRKKCCHAILFLPVLAVPANATTRIITTSPSKSKTDSQMDDGSSSGKATGGVGSRQRSTVYLQWHMLSEYAAVVVGLKLGRVVIPAAHRQRITRVHASFGPTNAETNTNDKTDEEYAKSSWCKLRVTITGVSGIGQRPTRHHIVDNALAMKLRREQSPTSEAAESKVEEEGGGDPTAESAGSLQQQQQQQGVGILVDGGKEVSTAATAKGQRLLFALNWDDLRQTESTAAEAPQPAKVLFHVELMVRVELVGTVPPVFPNYAPPAPHVVEYSVWVSIDA